MVHKAEDKDLDRLIALAHGGHNGVNLADLSPKARRELLTRPATAL
jgi:hypothetical protein